MQASPARWWLGISLLAYHAIAPSPAESDDAIPLYSFNQSPLVQIFGLPAIGDARVLSPEDGNLSLHLQLANNFTDASNRNEHLVLDGETHRFTLVMRQGLANGREWGIELPYVTQSGGFLDGPIEHWHSAFGLPDGGRPGTTRNLINYRYTRDGADLVRVTQSTSGVGDVRLTGASQLVDAPDGQNIALRGSLKFATGDNAGLQGSGSTDLALWLSMAPKSPPAHTLNGYGGAGILFMNKGNVLPAQHRSYVTFGSIGLGMQLFSTLTVNAQLDGHSPFYEGSDFRQLSAYAIQGLLGLSWEFSPKKHLGASVSEDLVINTSPDVVFTLSLTLPF